MQQRTETLMATAPAIRTINDMLKTYTFGADRHKPLLVVGAHGVGKSFGAMSMGYQKMREGTISNVFEIGGSDSFTSAMFLGHATIGQDKQIIWVDGKYTEAFRAASKATVPVLLIMDEILQIPGNVISPLLSSMVLNPGDGMLHLNTGRVMGQTEEGIAVQEIIKCDPKMLRIVATANEGQGYQSKEMNVALADRFVKYRMTQSPSEASNILLKKMTEYGSRATGKGCLPVNTHTSLLALQAEQQKAAATGSLPNGDKAHFSIRTLATMLEMCGNTAVGLRTCAYDQVFRHCGQDSHGSPIASQVTVHQTLIEKFLGAAVFKDDPLLVSAMHGTMSASTSAAQPNNITFKPNCDIRVVSQAIAGLCSQSARQSLILGNYITNTSENMYTILFGNHLSWEVMTEMQSTFSCSAAESIRNKAAAGKMTINAAFKAELQEIRKHLLPAMHEKVDSVIESLL